MGATREKIAYPTEVELASSRSISPPDGISPLLLPLPAPRKKLKEGVVTAFPRRRPVNDRAATVGPGALLEVGLRAWCERSPLHPRMTVHERSDRHADVGGGVDAGVSQGAVEAIRESTARGGGQVRVTRSSSGSMARIDPEPPTTTALKGHLGKACQQAMIVTAFFNGLLRLTDPCRRLDKWTLLSTTNLVCPDYEENFIGIFLQICLLITRILPSTVCFYQCVVIPFFPPSVTDLFLLRARS